jgi:hypothetical protein
MARGHAGRCLHRLLVSGFFVHIMLRICHPATPSSIQDGSDNDWPQVLVFTFGFLFGKSHCQSRAPKFSFRCPAPLTKWLSVLSAGVAHSVQ